MHLEIPYCPKDVIESYIAGYYAMDYDGAPTYGFDDFIQEIDCPNFNYRDAALCYRLDWDINQTSKALRALDEENQIDGALLDHSERCYFDDQYNG